MYEKKTVRETCTELGVNPKQGLSTKEAEQRYQRNGKNELAEAHKKSVFEAFFEQLNDPLIYVLLLSAFVSLLLQEISDAVIILVVVLMNAVVGIVQEGKAQKALDSLKKLTSPHAVVLRDGKKCEIEAKKLVTGDLVCLEAGCQVPADLRLIHTESLKIEESALTGESLPMEKNASFQALPERKDIPLGDRHNMAYMSTIVTYGRGEGVVVATGMDTQIGKIASLIHESREELTPLQKRLGELGKVLSVLSLVLCALLFGIALLQERNVFDMLLTAISLAVAAVPEGLPAVVTICLALSVTRMVKVHTIVRRLPSVETLGAVSVVCSDKTGTLTQNRMTVVQYFLDMKLYERAKKGEKEEALTKNAGMEKDMKEFLQCMCLCNDAVYEEESRMGDPTELALLEFADSYGIRKEETEQSFPRVGELAFDSDRKMMSTFHRHGSSTISYTKGAPDEVLKKCTGILLHGRAADLKEGERRQIREAVRRMSSQALRTLAVAIKYGGNGPSEEKLIFVGLVGMQDPPRPEAAGAVEQFREAGVTTVMITGDHVDTAFAIAGELGIVERKEQCVTGEEMNRLDEEAFLKRLEQVRVFARISPEQKVRIVRGFKERGNIVAMTGDGVNDAPSLKAADIGIAMGMNGTDVAKQASDMILTDDNFATIEKAIEEGRGVYENIKKSVIFLLSSNLGEIMTMFLAVLCGLASPLKSSHILWINLITDSLPALALGVDKNDGRSLMRKKPRHPQESLFADGGFSRTCFYGILIAGISLTAFFTIPYTLLQQKGMPFTMENLTILLQNETVLRRAQTYAFTVLGMSQLFHAVGMRDVHRSIFRINHANNPLMLTACIIGFALQFAVTEVSFLIQAFGTVHLSGEEWTHLTILAAFPLLGHELLALLSFSGGSHKKKSIKKPESCPV
ncbi:MAG: cation-translocating P-type ATPase [Lachnospiraceae bacterium]|nr:cation-translocating P-type ATPase [Lachnospiraceae bacterium]